MKYLGFLLLFLMAIMPVRAQDNTSPWNGSPSPKYEVRAVWLTTLNGLDWPRTKGSQAQKQELISILDKLQQAGINTVLFQTRVRATVVYPSKIEPWDLAVTGIANRVPDYDVLQFCIDECHKRGMECHAWVCTIPIGKWNKLGCKEFRKKHPKMVKRIGEEGYMDPSHPETADYLARICREIVSHYDVDGIHLDYIRYPETWKLKISKAQARNHITRIVSAIHKAVKAEKPWVKMSCSPIGKYGDLTRYRAGGWNAYNTVAQDAQLWMRQGLMDQLYPMMYFQGDNFYPFAIDWQEQSNGRTIVSGLGIYFLDPKEGKWTHDIVEREMSVTRQIGIGHCYFRSKFLTDNHQGIYNFAADFDRIPALVPPMTWAGKPAPSAPSTLTMEGNTLTWDTGRDNSGGIHLLYNIYASTEFPVDITKAENIVAVRQSATSMLVPKGRYNYAVTAMDRYGQESEAVQIQLLPATTTKHHARASRVPSRNAEKVPVITSDGAPIALPAKGSTLDADFIVIETMQGAGIAVRPYTLQLNLTSIPDGMYQIRSLGRKGRTHRLLYLYLKRNKHIL